MRIAGIADLHCPTTSAEALGPLLAHAAREADVLLLGGDLTDRGLEDEARLLARSLAAHVRIPVLAVLGNHDYESGKAAEVRAILADVGVRVLDGEAVEIDRVGFVGVKGFAGGFGQRALQPWGEAPIKRFVQAAVEEAVKLEAALAKLQTPHRVVVMHYAPVEATVKGEAPELYPFLGSSRLEEPLVRYAVSAVFHGHAHSGSPEGRTRGDTPVYNVALPVLERAFPDRPAVRTIALPR